ncbi:gluconolactonase [Dictyobacter sp. S3.2.2.5]|uniref:Gluconolactonase n=1 Tax=Dictyobacter halimunensis TaxID=3026934 RepID=A0ABQ6FNW7_9CHLR|nr:gluconolactonase [Dictyobacter sp. S3.2.2.5]
MNEIEVVLASADQLGESPLWSIDEQTLYWVDDVQGIIHRLRPATGSHETFTTGIYIGMIALRQSGGLALTTRTGFAIWEPGISEPRPLAQPEQGKPHMTFNDGAVDCAGHLWSGSMNQNELPPPVGTLYRLDPGGTVTPMLAPVGLPNGIGWSPDNRVMYFTDSLLRTIFAFDFDPDGGTITNQRVFVHDSRGSTIPDGLTVDAEGYVWSACWGTGQIVRYTPSGAVDSVLQLPVPNVTSCIFGGLDLNELYITTAREGLSHEQQQQYPLSGALFRLKTTTRGREEFKFRG